MIVQPERRFRAATNAYSLLPFRFTLLDEGRYVATNIAGEYCTISKQDLYDFIGKKLDPNSTLYTNLKAKHFLTDNGSTAPLLLLATKYRTKAEFLSDLTSLHLFVVTLRCNNRCVYCQASRQCEDRQGFDMSRETADRAVEFMFRSPSSQLKVEFQGGEPLLNFPLVQHIVSRARERGAALGRPVEFVLCSNLSLLDENVLRFCDEHDVTLSTSLDGPKDLHNYNRPSPEFDSYVTTVNAIKRAMNHLGPGKVSALMTTTRRSLECPEAIVDEYVRRGFCSLFLRMLNPYGYAARTNPITAYSTDEFLAFYQRALKYILELNYAGVPFREEYAAIILRKILTPYSTGFVDLQSPAGAGLNVIAFHYDGNVYLSDEARMLAEMGDQRFRMGNLYENTYEEVMLDDGFLDLISRTMTEGVPGCVDCAFQPYCGSDPIRHYRTQGDVVGHKALSEFCRKHMALYRFLIQTLEDDAKAAAVLESWVY
ncbi:MAG: His-Xaa-Ser system radical SAM maturase HxsB [Bryobacteraceae bacterium]